MALMYFFVNGLDGIALVSAGVVSRMAWAGRLRLAEEGKEKTFTFSSTAIKIENRVFGSIMSGRPPGKRGLWPWHDRRRLTGMA